MNSEEHGLSIEDLATQAGVPPRTIRYYIAEGLLPGPGARGKAATYSEEHLLRLRLIRRLVEQRVPLSEVRARLSSLSVDDIRKLLAEQDQFLTELQRVAVELTPRDYISSLLRQAKSVREPVSRRSFVPSPDSPELSPSMPLYGASSEKMQAAGVWHRYVVEPGVELFIRSDVVDRYQHLIRILRQAAGQTDR